MMSLVEHRDPVIPLVPAFFWGGYRAIGVSTVTNQHN